MENPEAETVATSALAWLAEEPDRIGAFLGTTGLDPADVVAAARTPEFLGAVLDFVLSDDALVLAFASAVKVAPERVGRARAALPGGDDPHWT
ncbi:MAG: DUF3572 domain-containing protein [Pseudomonadota bacterium]